MAKVIPITPTSLGTMETCPRQFQAKYVTKEVVFQESLATIFGNRLHTAMEHRLRDGTPLTEEFAYLEGYAQMILTAPGELLVEQAVAVDAQLQPCSWRDRWIGGKADVIKVRGTVATVLDWKSGKVKDDPLQLDILTLCIFMKYPEVQTVNAGLIFTQHGKVVQFSYTRDEFIRALNVKLLQKAEWYRQVQESGKYMPKPSGLCKQWCDVVRCEFNGKRST